jgi:hypothetical protein
MAAAMVDNLFSKCVKLTSSRYMIKISDRYYVIISAFDNKKFFLNKEDIECLHVRIFESLPPIDPHDREEWADAFLEKSIVKWYAEKGYYAFINRKSFTFEMGMMKDTIQKIVNFHSSF